MRIVLATCLAQPEIWHDDVPLLEALRARGVHVDCAPWNGPFQPFAVADLVVVRSTWDYADHYAAFLPWFDALGAHNVKVANSTHLMRWNVDKHYLTDLAARGAPLPDSQWVASNREAIIDACAARGWMRAVVKPAIGGGGAGVHLINAGDEETIEQAISGNSEALLLQAFVPEIRTLGETSLVYIDGVFSHAAVKRPAEGVILCQPEHGGAVMAAKPPQWAIEAGEEIIRLLPEPPLFARIDAILLEDQMRLMEAEVAEPELFFTYAEGAAERFADALLAHIS